MATTGGFDIILYALDAYTVYLEGESWLEDLLLEDGENFYDLTDKGNLIQFLKFRVLGLQEHLTDANEDIELNNILIKDGYLYLNFLLDGFPLSVMEDNDMVLFHKLSKFMACQYKFLLLDADSIEEASKYPIFSNIPQGKAMLFSNTGNNNTFNYSGANRSVSIPIRSYFPIHNSEILI
jgi:hypothetical protein